LLGLAVACRGAPAPHEPAGVPHPSQPSQPSQPSHANQPHHPQQPHQQQQQQACGIGVPAAACAMFGAATTNGQLTACDAATEPESGGRGSMTRGPARIGEWRYALVAPLYSPVETITRDELAASWSGKGERTLQMTRETHDALAVRFGTTQIDAPAERLAVDTKRWAIVPAHELVPHYKVVAIDGKHPLTDDTALTVPLCARTATKVRNIDPDAMTTVAMTGVTAMARFTAKLMDAKGVTYPARDVAPWFERTAFVHVSNEVSFVPTCEPVGDRTEPFCSRESYIELLEALHVNIVELTGGHLQDFGRRWLTHTLEMYEARGWHTFGGGRDQVAATKPLLVEHHGNKLAFIGCNIPRSRAETIRSGGPENAFCDASRLDWEIRDLRARGYLPIVSLQHDEVPRHDPPLGLVRDFRRLAEAGAVTVFGSQAHVAHPFEVHAGSYLHYGAGNFIFDQPWGHTRTGTAVRYYFHRGRLLSVAHLYTNIEEKGRPRPMTDDERVTFLHTLAEALATLPPAKPWLAPSSKPAERDAPDSFIVGKEPILLKVAKPAVAAQRYALVIDLRARGARPDDAFTVTLRKSPTLRKKDLVRAITEFMSAKYPIDSARVTIR
jgi:poly-gamma-glutamate synthesis protein (capsule biosynthesis protein)